jgi:hypothetical protein
MMSRPHTTTPKFNISHPSVANKAPEATRYRIITGDVARKAQILLDQRRVFSVAQSELDQESLSEWSRTALTIQAAIYRIDRYFETSSCIDPKTEVPMWREVECHLRGSARRRDAEVWGAFADLRRYADVERRIHAFDAIDAREFESFLFLKCSDVRLSRYLIWSYRRRAPRPYESAFWSIYDECWELIEDISDLDEDGTDWNFNFWLYSFMAGRSATEGIEAVSALLERKISELQDIFRCIPTISQSLYAEPFDWTVKAARRVACLQSSLLVAISTGCIVRFNERSDSSDLSSTSSSEYTTSMVGTR